jgi:alkylated DNA repair dioxygenase AlkB
MLLLNWYQDGNHYIGYHRDDEKQLLQTATGESFVFSISFGATREFSLKPVNESVGHVSSRLVLRHGDALLMGGRCQKTHKHSILRVNGKKGAMLGRRINMTFRVFK